MLNEGGLKPAVEEDGSPAPISVAAELDDLGLLAGVRTFNAHGHLPHLRADAGAGGAYRVLARQRIDPRAPAHPSNSFPTGEFDALLWAPPAGPRAGNVVVCDATLWSSAFGGTESLRRLWENVLDVGVPKAADAVNRNRR
jgi:hypothetical protein